MSAAPSRLGRRLTVGDAVVIGLGAMLGAGVFSAIGPAAAAAGNALLIALVIAAAVAYCNATSTAQLAARYPEAGGAYAYGRHQLGPFWGFVAGWGFVTGKIASVAAMALTFGHYAAPGAPRPAAAAAVLALTAVNLLGVKKTVALTRVIVGAVIVALAVVIAGLVAGAPLEARRLWPVEVPSPFALLGAASLLFFAFAGYARIATLGEEVIAPERTIPRAIPLALGLVLAVYLAVALAALTTTDVSVLAASAAPLADALATGRARALVPVVRIGAAVASVGVMLSLLAGLGRTVFAMAAAGDLPRALSAVHPRRQVPHRAELVVGALAAALASTLDLHAAIGTSSFAVLVYYGIANASALRLSDEQRRWPRALAVGGLVGCAALAACAPSGAVLGGMGLFLVGSGVYAIARARRS